MVPRQQLSPVYDVNLIRLAHQHDNEPVQAWPGLLLRSTTRSWPFDRAAAEFEDPPTELAGHAEACGLYRVDDPILQKLPDAAQRWTFHLPGLIRRAYIRMANAVVDLDYRLPIALTEEWWQLARARDQRCRLLIAAGIPNVDDPVDRAIVLRAAATSRLVVGATIAVEL